MARSKWRGDTVHLLPAQQVEPYRLWFEFLKLAYTDQNLSIDEKYYRRWGDVANTNFKKWWSLHWRELFAVDIGVRLASSREKSDSEAVIVRIPLYQDPKRSMAQVAKLLEEQGASQKLRDMVEGEFQLTVGQGDELIHPSTRFLRNLSKVRLLLHIYRFWLMYPDADDRRRLEKTAISYFQWADKWNRQVRERKWDRPRIEIPGAIRKYVYYLEKRGPRRGMSIYEHGDVSDERRQIARYIRKARRLAANVAEGRFPGEYER